MKKLIFILFIAHCTLQIANAQQPTEEWVARFTGPSNDLYGPFLQVDKQGNSYIAGTHVVNDTAKLLCIKYNTEGVQLWDALYIYPGEAYIRPTGLALDSSGNAYVIAIQGPAYDLPTNSLIAKFNSSGGSLAWVKRYAGQYGWSSFVDIKIDPRNNIYIVGASDTSHLVVRYNTNGDSVWVRKFHPPLSSESARSCTIDDSLNIIFTGRRRYSNPPDSLLVVKYSSGGVMRWESAYAFDNLVNVGTKITADQSGSVYIGGDTRVSGIGVYLTLKYNRNGVRQWAKIYNAPGSVINQLSGIAMDRFNNSFYVTGGAVVNGFPKAVTIKYNTATGDSIWIKRDSGNNNGGGGRDIKVDSSGNVYITGATYNYPSYNPYEIITFKYSFQSNPVWFITYNYGSYTGLDNGLSFELRDNNIYVLGTSQSGFQMSDYVLIKYNQILGIQPLSSELPKVFKLEQNYPNPFNPSTKIRFSVSKRSFVLIQVYDILGRIKELPVNDNLNPAEYEVILDGSNYSSGVYFYRLIADGNIIDTKKFIVLK